MQSELMVWCTPTFSGQCLFCQYQTDIARIYHLDYAPQYSLSVMTRLTFVAAVLEGEDSQGDDGNFDELEPDAVEEELAGQDELGDDELQSMLQDDDDSACAITDTANTDWYLHLNKAASMPSTLMSCYHWHMTVSTGTSVTQTTN